MTNTTNIKLSTKTTQGGPKMAKRKSYDKYTNAKETLREWFANGYSPRPEDDETIREALNIVVGRPDARSKKAQIREEVIEMLKKGPVADTVFFEKYSYGELEMRNIIKHFIREEAKNRVWIAYNDDTREYYIYGHGDDVPKGWSGYVPKDN